MSLLHQVIGSLASKPPADKDPLTGLLISKDFSYTLLDPKDLKDFTGLGTSEITQRQRVRIGVSWDVVRWHLEGMYGEVEEDVVDGRAVFIVSLSLASDATTS
jgi:cleavage and polyadenylation specificity factor subunit 3